MCIDGRDMGLICAVAHLLYIKDQEDPNCKEGILDCTSLDHFVYYKIEHVPEIGMTLYRRCRIVFHPAWTRKINNVSQPSPVCLDHRAWRFAHQPSISMLTPNTYRIA